MTTITAKVILDSVSPQGIRLPSVQCRYPKIIHGEAKTHRVFSESDVAYEALGEIGVMDVREFSRNASSSRAVPVVRLIDDVMTDPYIPVHWGRNQKGMQAYEELQGAERQAAIDQWMFALEDAVWRARKLAAIGVAKQIVNRIIEPYSHINTLITSTEWANFFALRCHPAAQPEMRMLAEAIRDALAASTPDLIHPGEWHTPYVDAAALCGIRNRHGYDHDHHRIVRTLDSDQVVLEAIKVSVACSARLSYLTHDGRKAAIEEDLALYDRLVGDNPLHASPAEHQATPDGYSGRGEDGKVVHWSNPHLHGNFVGWRQFRKTLPGERVLDR